MTIPTPLITTTLQLLPLHYHNFVMVGIIPTDRISSSGLRNEDDDSIRPITYANAFLFPHFSPPKEKERKKKKAKSL